MPERRDSRSTRANDDNIVADLVTGFSFGGQEREAPPLRIVGGLLGQWAVWTREASSMLRAIREQAAAGTLGLPALAPPTTPR